MADMIDFFGRPVEAPAGPDAQPRTGEDEWGCYACAGVFGWICPVPITIVGPRCALYVCSDLCALAAGFGYAARARRVSEDSGFGWQITIDFAGRPVWFDDFAILPDERTPNAEAASDESSHPQAASS